MQVKKRRLIWISAVCLVLIGPLVVMPLTAVIIYESIFSSRYETLSWMEFSVSDFEGLTVERSDFQSDGVRLAGYCYQSAACESPRGVVVVAHGMGGGGHNTYMPFIDRFTAAGYLVFAYDARGNDNSDGDSVEGLPQGVIDLDAAIRHVRSLERYRELPILLFGHSWGAYAAGNVLNFHPDVAAAVLIAGFNESEDMLLYQSSEIVGPLARGSLFYVEGYERLKFGRAYTEITAVEGMRSSEAQILVVHSRNDATVPPEYGYDCFYREFSTDERFDFVLYEDRGHDYLFYSDAAWAYREQLNEDYLAYVEANGGEFNAEIKEKFMRERLDKRACFEPDPLLMERIFSLFDRALA